MVILLLFYWFVDIVSLQKQKGNEYRLYAETEGPFSPCEPVVPSLGLEPEFERQRRTLYLLHVIT